MIISKKIRVVCSVLFFVFFCLPQFVSARSSVRVGYCDSYGIISGRDGGSYQGYGYEYLNKIAEYTGWTYIFVQGSWEECLKRLETGEIDILGPIQYTAERSVLYDFPPVNAGYEYGALYISNNNNSIFYDDFQAFDGMRVGVIAGNYYNTAFEEYRQRNGFSVEYVYLDSSSNLDLVLDSGMIDAVSCGSLINMDNAKVAAKYAVKPFYFAAAKGVPDILAALTEAVNKIKVEDIYYDARLYEKYFRDQAISHVAYTREESLAIQAYPVLRVAYKADWTPVEYYDEKSDGFRGISAELMNIISERSGIRFEYIPYFNLPDGLPAISAGQADAVCGYVNPSGNMSSPVIIETVSYIDAPLLMIGKTGMPVNFNMSISLPSRYSALQSRLEDYYTAAQIIIYDTLEECIDAVREGKNNVVLISSYMFDELMRNPDNRDLAVISMSGITFSPCIGLAQSVDPVLVSVLNKAIARITNEERNTIVFANTVNREYAIPFSRILREYYIQIIILICMMFAAVIVLILYNRKKMERELSLLAYTDPLTGARSIEKFRLDAGNFLRKNTGSGYVLAYVDIDKFKYINDMFGYEAGNTILKQMSKTLETDLSGDELFARVSADNFVVLLAYGGDEALLARFEYLHRKLYAFSSGEMNYYKLVLNCGIYRIHAEDTGIDTIMDKANTARKTIKGGHSSSCAFYSEVIHNRVMREKEIEDIMGAALENGEFCVYMQPQYRIADNTIAGVEALVRWQSPGKGLIPPDDFVPLFEKNGFIIEIDFFVFEEVCKKIREWLDRGEILVPVSVNISRIHLRNRDFIDKLKLIVNRYGIPVHLIGLELTETAVQENLEDLLDIMRQLREIGFVISMDDFGTGYSSLNLLKELPVDMLKLDRMFFTGCSTTERERIIISSIVRMAKELHIEVICEGVELQSQADFLRDIGCDMIQGYLYAKPMPIEELEALMRAETAVT